MQNEQDQNLNNPNLASQGEALQEQNTLKSPILKNKWLKIGIGFVILLTIIGATYFLGKNSASKTQEQTAKIPPSPTVTADPTANWKTFNSEKYKFSIKYPTNWIFVPNKNVDSQLQFSNYNIIGPNAENGILNLDTPKDAITLTLSITPSSLNICKNPPDSFNSEKTSFNFDGVQGYKYVSNPAAGNQNPVYSIYYTPEKAGNCYMFVFQATDLKYRDQYINLADQILSTFKFTDQANQEINPTSTTDQMANWKSYSDANYPFQIKYPENWNIRTTYGKSVNNLNNHRIAGIDISDNLTYGSTVVVNVMSYDNEGFQEWMKLYSGHGHELPYKENSTYNGNLAYRFTYPIDQKPDGVEIYYRYKDKVIFIAWHTPTADQQTLVDKILNTLKFN